MNPFVYISLTLNKEGNNSSIEICRNHRWTTFNQEKRLNSNMKQVHGSLLLYFILLSVVKLSPSFSLISLNRLCICGCAWRFIVFFNLNLRNQQTKRNCRFACLISFVDRSLTVNFFNDEMEYSILKSEYVLFYQTTLRVYYVIYLCIL